MEDILRAEIHEIHSHVPQLGVHGSGGGGGGGVDDSMVEDGSGGGSEFGSPLEGFVEGHSAMGGSGHASESGSTRNGGGGGGGGGGSRKRGLGSAVGLGLGLGPNASGPGLAPLTTELSPSKHGTNSGEYSPFMSNKKARGKGAVAGMQGLAMHTSHSSNGNIIAVADGGSSSGGGSSGVGVHGYTDIDPPATTSMEVVDAQEFGLDDQPKPYASDSQLEYLEESFTILGLKIRGNAARIKDDMKKEGTRMTQYYDSADLKQGKRELYAKVRLLEGRLARRVEATRQAGRPLPRLEQICELFDLDEFDKHLLVLVIGKTISPIVRTLIETLEQSRTADLEATTVGQALGILCQDFQTQLVHRRSV